MATQGGGPAEGKSGDRAALALLLLSVILFALRARAAQVVGFGDSEALYACYALHPQPAYLDHPGLIGEVGRILGRGLAPRPSETHLITATAATLVPLLVALVARVAGAGRIQASVAGLVTASTPMLAVGLFAFTPDLLLAPLWLLVLALALFGLGEEPGSTRGSISLLFAGVFSGLASSAKVSGFLLFPVLAAGLLLAPDRVVRRSPWAWMGMGLGLFVAAPSLLYEASSGFPMLHHRLVATQSSGPPLVKGLGALTVGQLVYLSPLVLLLALLVARDLFAARRAADARIRLLALACFVPAAALCLFTLFSRQAEPHWIAPALLALPVHGAVQASRGKVLGSARLHKLAIGTGAALTLAVHAWVLSPGLLALAPASYEPRYDIANELHGWPRAFEAIRESITEDTIVVGPHWTICAQIHAGMPGVRVGCATPIQDDFDRWLPRSEWKSAPRVLFVSDNRFDTRAEDIFPGWARTQESRVTILRGGRRIRTFTLTRLEYAAHASRVNVPSPSCAGSTLVVPSAVDRSSQQRSPSPAASPLFLPSL